MREFGDDGIGKLYIFILSGRFQLSRNGTNGGVFSDGQGCGCIKISWILLCKGTISKQDKKDKDSYF